MKRLSVAVCLALLAGCGLPVSKGVHEPGQVPPEERQAGDIQVLPPGPRDDASPADIIRGFFGAQSSPEDAHASAREFLAPEARATWRDNAPVGVLENGTRLTVTRVTGEPDTFRVTGVVVAEIAGDGSYTPDRRSVDEQVHVRRGPRGRWQITDVPDGLLLSAADRERSFRARNMYYLAAPPSPGSASSHLVPDQVFLPVTAANAEGLVRRLIRGPSKLLGDSVSTAFPSGTDVRSVREVSGLVTVDLTAEAGAATELQREQMSAQLVWTLRGLDDFAKLRFLSAGRPIAAGGGGESVLRDRSDWQQYDPDGLPARPPLYYIAGRRLRQLLPAGRPVSEATRRQVVDSAAASPRGGGLALIARGGSGAELRTGPAAGPFVLRARAGSLSFLSWGSGEQGVWYLQNGRVMLAGITGRPVDVPIDELSRFGPLYGLRVSRDGARVALIAGVGNQRRLLVARIVDRVGGLRIVGLRSVAPDVANVSDVTWDSATSLVVLGLAAGVTAPVSVAVDGSKVELVRRLGLERSQPVSLAAAPDQPLEVAATLAGAHVLFRAGGLTYVREQGVDGSEPFYPG